MAIDCMAINGYPDLAESLARGRTLPAAWYTAPEVFALEKRRIFGRAWQYAGYLEQAATPGDFFTCLLGEVPIVVARDTEGELRAFANVCRHRGSTLVLEEAGCRKTIQCHYHGWTWNLDGSLRNAPRWNEQPSFNKDDFPLIGLQVATWGPLIFVNPDRQAPPLSAILQQLPGIVAATGLDFAALRFRTQLRYEIAANWKIVVENFNECYHCPIAHPSFCDLIDTEHYSVVTDYEFFSTQHGAVTAGAKAGKQAAYDVGEAALGAGVRDAAFGFIWPNITFDINPGPHNLVVGRYAPIDEGHTRLTLDCFFADSVDAQTMQGILDFTDVVQREDIVLCESMQRGMRSGFFSQGQLMLSRENGIQHFQKLVHRFLSQE